MDAAQSGAIGDNQSSSLETTVTGPAMLSFWWKVDSEANFDFLKVTVDGVAALPRHLWQRRLATEAPLR